jgi:alpha-1,3-rhamnosyltransferase
LVNGSDRPLVTYIVASYNHDRFVRAAIESIVRQEYCPIELIVVDDGSTDQSPKILEDLRNKYRFCLIKKKNAGICSVVNEAVPLARGEFIVLHASDDVSHPSRTTSQVEILQEDPKIGFTVGAIRNIDERGKTLDDWPPASRRIFTFDDFRMGRGRAFAVSSMYRAEAMRSALPLDESIIFEDVQLYWRTTENGFVCVRDDSVKAVYKRVVRGSLGTSNSLRLNDGFFKFISAYSNRDWYPSVFRRAMKARLGILVKTNKKLSLRFIYKNPSFFSWRDIICCLPYLLIPGAVLIYIRSVVQLKRYFGRPIGSKRGWP